MKALDTFKKAASWAFNNNGNVVDYTRRRLVDGTPLHSTGITRLIHDWSLIAPAAVITAALGITALSKPQLLMRNGALTLAIAPISVGLFRTTNKRNMAKIFENHADLCFNTDPHETATSPEHMQLAKDVIHSKVTTVILGALASAVSVPVLADPSHYGFFIFTSGTYTALTYDSGHMLRFKKTLDGEWIIEDAPPPQKKQPEREPLLGQLNALLPKPVPVQA